MDPDNDSMNKKVGITFTRLSDGLILHVNERYVKMLGFTINEMMSKTTLTTNVWLNLDERNAVISQLLEKGSIETRILKVRKNDGEIKDVWFSAELIEIDNEKYSIGIIQDI